MNNWLQQWLADNTPLSLRTAASRAVRQHIKTKNMNQAKKIVTILLIWQLSATVFGQNCFVVSDDITGIENQTTILVFIERFPAN
jgi:predicted XRE-type DNA-binding protein